MNIPLRYACLAPVSVIVPLGTVLNLAKHVAVCAGSPITPQHSGCYYRGVGAYAASQNCFNIISFGIGGVDPKNGMEVTREYLLWLGASWPEDHQYWWEEELEVQPGERTLVNTQVIDV